MRIDVDQRETRLIELLKGHHDVEVQIVNMDVGDVRFVHDDTVLCIIERKTLADLSASIVDGRYRDQKHRLLDNYDKSIVMYVIEGNMFGATDAVRGAIINTMLRDKIRVFMVNSIQETVMFLSETYKRLLANPSKYMGGDNTCSVVALKPHSKKKYMTKDVFFKSVLCQVPGVSTNTAAAIVASFGTFSGFIANCDVGVIAELKLPSGKRIGSKVAQNIVSYIQ